MAARFLLVVQDVWSLLRSALSRRISSYLSSRTNEHVRFCLDRLQNKNGYAGDYMPDSRGGARGGYVRVLPPQTQGGYGCTPADVPVKFKQGYENSVGMAEKSDLCKLESLIPEVDSNIRQEGKLLAREHGHFQIVMEIENMFKLLDLEVLPSYSDTVVVEDHQMIL
ncbi:hypothetical protein Tco_1099423 [Tanacetum coccineum]